MARNFQGLEARMGPERRARVQAKARETMVEMVLAELRRQTGKTQVEVAKSLGVTQPSLSKLESQDDMQISTLRRIVHALGGELELIARMPGGPVRLSPFANEPG